MLRLPFSASHRGLSGINKNPMNIISDGKPAKPSMYLKKCFHHMVLSATIATIEDLGIDKDGHKL